MAAVSKTGDPVQKIGSKKKKEEATLTGHNLSLTSEAVSQSNLLLVPKHVERRWQSRVRGRGAGGSREGGGRVRED